MFTSVRSAARLLGQQNRFALRGFSSATSTESSSSTNPEHIHPQKFSFFPRPKEVIPVMEITRKLGGNVAETVYQIAFEKQYSREGLIRGANQGICTIANSIADGNWNRLATVATVGLTEQSQEIRTRLSDSVVNLLRFNNEDIVCSFLHSSLIAGKELFKLSSSGNLGIYFTVVSFIRLNSSVPDSISMADAIKKYKEDVLVANVTFARTLNPLGSWKATTFNFFVNN